jgi:putative ABC transport system permease protein
LNPVDIITMAFDGVRSRKFRFALNIIGILIGCAAVTGLISMTQGLSDSVGSQLQVLGPQTIIVIPGSMRNMQGFSSSSSLTWRDITTVSKIENIDLVTPIIANKIGQYSVKGTTYTTTVYGITEQYAEINTSTEIAQGRMLVRSDSGVVIIGANIAQPLNKDEPILELGSRINMEASVNGVKKTITLRVVGILKKTGGSFGANLDDAIAIPLQDAEQFYDVAGKYTYVMARAQSTDVVNSAAKAIKNKMGKSVTVITYDTAREQINSVMGTIGAVLGGIAAISLIVAGVGIINTMTVSVMERTKEIGTLKALGAKSRDVLMMFLSESVLTGFFGGLLGAGLGVALSSVIGQFIGLEINPQLGLSIEVVGFAIITSVLSGLYPAWRASNLSPVEALRHE